MKTELIIAIFLSTSIVGFSDGESGSPDTAEVLPHLDLKVDSVTTLADPGGNLDWSPDGSWIAYSTPDAQGWNDTWLMRPDGSDRHCLTCDNPSTPTPLHLGNPTWHNDQQWIVIQGVKQFFYNHFPSTDADYKKRIMDVGVGIGNELWAMSSDGQSYTQLTNVWEESTFAGGVLHAHFSHDGHLLAWTQRLDNISGDPGGEWAIKTASFVVEDGIPRLKNILTHQPGLNQNRMYEIHSFSSDDSLLLYSSNSDGQESHGYDIYALDLDSGHVTQLTQTRWEWDEHAQYSPDDRHIIWMSSANAGSTNHLLKTELWYMQADGSMKTQLTFFNDPDSSMYTGDLYGVVPADSSWSPDGTRLAVYVIVNQSEQTEYSMPGRIVTADISQFHLRSAPRRISKRLGPISD